MDTQPIPLNYKNGKPATQGDEVIYRDSGGSLRTGKVERIYALHTDGKPDIPMARIGPIDIELSSVILASDEKAALDAETAVKV
jgi:hypothetical protein